ncbi:hypothetical protein LINPERHAP1_LOCUS17115, partial [Linum perenne]
IIPPSPSSTSRIQSSIFHHRPREARSTLNAFCRFILQSKSFSVTASNLAIPVIRPQEPFRPWSSFAGVCLLPRYWSLKLFDSIPFSSFASPQAP